MPIRTHDMRWPSTHDGRTPLTSHLPSPNLLTPHTSHLSPRTSHLCMAQRSYFGRNMLRLLACERSENLTLFGHILIHCFSPRRHRSFCVVRNLPVFLTRVGVALGVKARRVKLLKDGCSQTFIRAHRVFIIESFARIPSF